MRCAANPSADIATGLAALVNRVTTRPGTCWRVGVGYVTAADQAKAQDEAAAAAAAAAAEKRILLRQATHKSKAKPAVMVVSLIAGMGCSASSSVLVTLRCLRTYNLHPQPAGLSRLLCTTGGGTLRFSLSCKPPLRRRLCLCGCLPSPLL